MWRFGNLRRRVDALVSRARFERDLRDEVRQHLEARTQDLVQAGLTPEAAARQARIEFGAIEAYKEQCRDARGFAVFRPLHGLGGDIRLASRRLMAAPIFTTFAALSLAVGIGVTTAAYSVVSSVFFKSSGIADERDLASVMTPWGGRLSGGGISTPDFEDLRTGQRAFSAMTASATLSSAIATPTTTDLMRGEAVDGAYFSMLGIRPLIGRGIDAADVARSAPVAVLSHALWRLRFEARPDAIGQTIRIGGREFEIIGVAPREFEGLAGPFDGTRLWIALTAEPGRPTTGVADRDRARLQVLGRLAPGQSIEQASAELSAIGANLDRAYPRTAPSDGGPVTRAWVARRFADQRAGEDEITRRFGLTLIGLVALVLVVACTNLANLVLARGATRQQEFVVRRAIGASRWRLVREQVTESLLLALLGGGAAWAVFLALGRVLDVDLPIGSRLMVSFAPRLDPAALVIALAALLVSLVVFGLEPALRLTREPELRTELAASAGSVGVPRGRRHRALVRWQVAISTGFFIIASMCVKYAVAEARHDSGVDLNRLAIATMNFWAQQWDEARARQTLARVRQEIEKDPSIETAAISTGVPFGASSTQALTLSTTDKPITEEGQFEWGIGIAATPRFFQAMGIRLVRGRGFDDRDSAAGSPVVVLSEQTARHLFGTADVVGRQMLIRNRTLMRQGRSVARKLAVPGPPAPQLASGVRTATIVGIAENTDVVHLFKSNGDVVYLPLDQNAGGLPFAMAIARTAGDPAVAVRALREALRRADPDVAIESTGTGIGMLGGPTVFLRAASAFAVSLGALTLLLAMIGLFGVQSHAIAQRTREIGVRMSFGATAAHIRGMVLKDGYRPVLEGLALGIFIGFVGRGIVRAYLWERIGLVDPWMFLAVPVPLILAAFFACYIPARRAARVDPNEALRHL